MCKSVVLKSLQTLDEGMEDIAELASLTKAKVSTTAHRAATEAIQMHGGIGVTDELDVGLYFKRIRVLQALLGDSDYHLSRASQAAHAA